MARPKFVQIPPHRLDRFKPLLGEGYGRVEAAAVRARRLFEGRAIWHVSSTLRGGGVAEMLRSLLPYVRGAGIDTRWIVLRERAEFFELTKRLHNNLHGDPGDGGPLGAAERELYEETLAASARHLSPLLQPGDIVFLHDPQTAGLRRRRRRPERESSGAVISGPTARTRSSGAPGTSSIPTFKWRMPTCSLAASTSGRCSTASERGWRRPASTPSRPRTRSWTPATVEAIVGAIGLGRKLARARAHLHPRRRHPRSSRAPCRDLAGDATSGGRAGGGADLTLGPAQGPPRPALVLPPPPGR